MSTLKKPAAQHDKADKSQKPSDDNPAMQGEGNYTAARNYRESTEQFVEDGKVEQAAQAAQPESEEQARQLREAEDAGKKPARR